MLMIDIDKFKSINDRFGHVVGDEVLSHVARTMASVTRKADLLSRYGGEEFCVVMPRTSYAGVTATAERVRRAVEEHPVVTEAGEEVRVTISVGGAAILEVDRGRTPASTCSRRPTRRCTAPRRTAATASRSHRARTRTRHPPATADSLGVYSLDMPSGRPGRPSSAGTGFSLSRAVVRCAAART